jgi:hypothetical protein
MLSTNETMMCFTIVASLYWLYCVIFVLFTAPGMTSLTVILTVALSVLLLPSLNLISSIAGSVVACALLGPLLILILSIHFVAHWGFKKEWRNHPGYEIITHIVRNHFVMLCLFFLSPAGIKHAFQVARVKLYYVARGRNSWTGGRDYFTQIAQPTSKPQYECMLQEDDVTGSSCVAVGGDDALFVNQKFALVETFSDLRKIADTVCFFDAHSKLQFVPSLCVAAIWIKDPATQAMFCFHFPGRYTMLFRAMSGGECMADLLSRRLELRDAWLQMKRSCIEARIVHTRESYEAESLAGRVKIAEAKQFYARNGYALLANVFETNSLSFEALRNYYQRVWKWKQTTQNQEGRGKMSNSFMQGIM